MLSLDKQAKTGTQRPQDEDTVVEIKNSTEMQGYKSSPLDQAGAFADQHQTVSHKMEADAGRNLLHGEQQNHENVHNGELSTFIKVAELILDYCVKVWKIIGSLRQPRNTSQVLRMMSH